MLAALFDASLAAALLAALIAAVASILFLRTRNFFHDSLALAATEIGLAVLVAGILAGAIGGRLDGRLWWTWDPRQTAALVCFLLYSPYLMLRNAIEEPTRRAASAAVVSIFAIVDIPAIAVAIHWWLARHAGASSAAPALTWYLAPVLALAAALTVVRLRQEQRRRAEDAARRVEQEI